MERREEPYLVLFTAAQTHQPGWNASTPDLLSNDWEILEPHETDYPREVPSKSAMDPVWDKVDAAAAPDEGRVLVVWIDVRKIIHVTRK